MDSWSNSCSSTTSNGSTMAMPPMSPKSPPGGFDLYGRRRQLLKLQVLEKDIGLLEEELKSIESFQAASKCCKEIDEFVGTTPDPLVAIKEEGCKSKLWRKRICVPWISCISGCQPDPEKPACCPKRKSHLHSRSRWEGITCKGYCECTRVSCVHLGSCCLNSSLSISNCEKVNLCCDCSKTCYDPRCL